MDMNFCSVILFWMGRELNTPQVMCFPSERVRDEWAQSINRDYPISDWLARNLSRSEASKLYPEARNYNDDL
jgi:hypothetical protein